MLGQGQHRVHVGGGRAGVSSGVGPFTLYQGVSGHRSKGSTRNSASATANTYRRQLAAAERSTRAEEQHAAALAAQRTLQELTSAHVATFAPVARPIASDPFDVNRTAVAQGFEQTCLAGIGPLDWGGRRAAKAQAALLTDEYLAQARNHAEGVRRQRQDYLDREWARLSAGDPQSILDVVAEALADNGAFATPVSTTSSSISIVLIAPPEDEMPAVKPHQNANGNWGTKKLTAAERNELYLDMLCSHVLATAKETFAVAPSLSELAVAVVRDEAPMGAPLWKVLLVAESDRGRIEQIDRASGLAPSKLLNALADIEIRFRANSSRILPLNPRQSGSAAAVLDRLERDDAQGEGNSNGPAPLPTPSATTPEPVTPQQHRNVAAGWYPDPWRQAEFRWWDGGGWSEHTNQR